MVVVVFLEGGGEGGGEIFVDNSPSGKIPKAQITLLIKICGCGPRPLYLLLG